VANEDSEVLFHVVIWLSVRLAERDFAFSPLLQFGQSVEIPLVERDTPRCAVFRVGGLNGEEAAAEIDVMLSYG
jgi:hypothetical protein